MSSKPKYHLFYISTGYVESASIGQVQLWNPKGFDSVLGGLYDLGLSIQKSLGRLNEYHNNQLAERLARGPLRDCCQATLAANFNRILCANCCCPIRERSPTATAEQVNHEINSMIRSTLDEYGYELTQELEHFGWELVDPLFLQSLKSQHYRVFVACFTWSPNLLSPQHNRHSALEWSEVLCSSVKASRHPAYDFDATDAVEEENE
jgi:hypothetical protein